MRIMISWLVLLILIAPATGHADELIQGLDNLIRILRRTSSPPQPVKPLVTQHQYWGAIVEAGTYYRVDPHLIHAVIRHESNFNPGAVSHKGARGLMQLMPATARLVGVNDSFDPVQNIHGGTRYLREMLDRFGDVRMALKAYNAGPTRVARGDIPRESYRYADRVMQTYYQRSAQPVAAR